MVNKGRCTTHKASPHLLAALYELYCNLLASSEIHRLLHEAKGALVQVANLQARHSAHFRKLVAPRCACPPRTFQSQSTAKLG